MIEPRLLTLQDLFADRVHYEVPIYQRSYAWEREEQWVPLWEDVRDTAIARLETDSSVAHFLGAIVIELTSADPGHVKCFSVIDGQQRLTTLQLLVAALRSAAGEFAPDRDVDLDRMLRNEGRHAEGPLAYKVWPSEHDRAAFRATLASADGGPPEADTGIPGVYHYFRGAISAWLAEGDSDDDAVTRLDALHDTVEGLLQVVSIKLDDSSDAQIIFETLNSRGADLTSLDLAKNSLLRQAGRDGVNVGELHAQHWQPALGDADYWLETVRQGRYTNERADLFLMHWLTMKAGKPARVQHLFADFRKAILRADPPPTAESVVIELGRDATIYRDFDSLEPTSIEGRFFQRLDLMDTTTLIPVALLLFRSSELSDDRRQRALRALESWLVRRMLLGATTQHYNRLLASMLTALHNEANPACADETILAELRGFSNPTDVWPSDEKVLERLLTQPLYTWINQRRIRMLLEACEQQMADTNRTEQLPLPEKLSIEHALPQTWQGHWPLPAGVDVATATAEREQRVHRLGNLTLVTSALNSSLSNALWPTKRLELARRSQLLVNQRLCSNDVWDEELIDRRGVELADLVVATWPGPSAPVWDAAA